ncbi:HD domain-containing phosphohydrolase [Calderihabitans maritimus]|uniref:Metal dependent phosphohydrolase n=1 Tax=Calderihabitans maritimus TaxID=1246530 RepID=A0A1Z5HPC2_9FIRM|nr:HD domain-containing phosphohydrolase [Calderihabitans maritimus]GAW91363.1 metal dependent phosphohydrolase [Calderihabitans maritimus]
MQNESSLLHFKELLEEAGLQQIQERVSIVTGLAVLVTDPEGKPISRASIPCSFCTMVNNTDSGRLRCMASRNELAKAAVKSGQPSLQLCHSGLAQIALPIKIKSETVAVTIGEGVSLKPLSLEMVPELARELGINGKELTEAARVIPVWTEERLREAVELFHAFTSTLFRLLNSRQQLWEKVEELKGWFELSQAVSSSLSLSEVAKRVPEIVPGVAGATGGLPVKLPQESPEFAVSDTNQEPRGGSGKEFVEGATGEANELRHLGSRTVEERLAAFSLPREVWEKITRAFTHPVKPEDVKFGEDEARFLSVLGTSFALALDRGLEEHAAMLKQLIEVGQLVSSSLEIDAIMRYALQSLKEVLGAKWCALRLLDEQTGELVLKANLEMSEDLPAEPERVRAEGTILGEVLKTARPLIVEDLAKGDPSLRLPYYSEEMRSVAVVPVQARGKVLGTLTVYTSSPHNWKEDTIGYLAIIASQVGLAVENAKLYESLRENYMSVVRALAAALEAKDKYTQGHSLRVARWAKAVARKMGLSEKEQEMVYIGGLLHDIGKVGVREYILLKADRLTEEEKKEIQSHPCVGAKILEPAKLPQEVVEAVLYHHEDYDGGGYPEGIAGDKIPLLARIIRVVDSYDAMTSDRPYRQAFSRQWVIEELNRCSGKQFDPEVVEAMKKVLEEDL